MPGFWPLRFWPIRALVAWFWPLYGVVVTPACRIYEVPLEDRVYEVPREDRVYEVCCG